MKRVFTDINGNDVRLGDYVMIRGGSYSKYGAGIVWIHTYYRQDEPKIIKVFVEGDDKRRRIIRIHKKNLVKINTDHSIYDAQSFPSRTPNIIV